VDDKATAARFWGQQRHRAGALSYGGTAEGLAFLREHTPKLAAAIERELASPSKGWQRELKAALRRLKPQDIAGTILWAFVSAIANAPGKKSDAVTIKSQVGDAIRTECDFGRLREEKPGTHAVIKRKMAQEGNLSAKRRVAAHWAGKAGFQWSSRELDLRTGILLWALCLKTLPELFTEVGRTPAIRAEEVDRAFAGLKMHPVFSPRPQPTKDWTGYRTGGYWTARSKPGATFVRNVYHAEDVAMYAAAMKREMREHVAGVSALQRVELRINPRIVDMLPHLEAMDLLDVTAKDIRTRKRQEKNNRTRVVAALCQAIKLWRFPLAKNCDTRGRVYNVAHFSLDREDPIRACFQFANGKAIGIEGLRWLKIHLANCGDFVWKGRRVSKLSFDERVRWVDANTAKLLKSAAEPIQCSWWKQADSPLMFLAACFELADAIKEGPTFQTRLPISFDGSCNGFQHLFLMARAPEAEASLVNLVASDEPNDIYQVVADRVRARLEAANDPIAKVCLGYGIYRKLIKPCVMTLPYSVSWSGMKRQLADGIGMKPGRDAIKYLVECLKEAVADVAPSAVKVQKHLRDLAGVLAKVGLLVHWSSPTGFPCVNRAFKRVVKDVDATVEIAHVGLRYQHKLADGYEDRISSAIARNRISPNFTHSMDAAHLIRVANACVAKGIVDFVMVHDSYGCLAPDAPKFRKIVLEELARLYRKNVLAELRARAEKDIAANPMAAARFRKKKLKLPEVPELGPLDLKALLNADYAFA
jgi:Autographiviridae RNA polymerase